MAISGLKCERLVRANGALIEEITRRSNDELYGGEWYRKYTKGRMIQLNTSSPYENARQRLAKWLKSQA